MSRPAASSRASTSWTCATPATPSSWRKRYYEQGADEVTFLDVTATVEDRATMYETVTATAEQVFIPLTVGGGVRTADDVARLLASGADKVGVNSAAIARPELVGEIADRFGAQVLVLSLDVKRSAGDAERLRRDDPRRPYRDRPGCAGLGAEAIERGAGELLVNSIDADGTKQGFDLELVAAIRAVEQRAGDRQRGSRRARALRARGRGRRRCGARRIGVPQRRADGRPGQGRAARGRGGGAMSDAR